MSRASVILEEYDPSWVSKFEAEKQYLMAIAGEWHYGSIEHVGSTAVPGMVAKPVIDVMFGVKSLEESKPAIEALVNNGYEYWPYKTEVMHWFCKPSDAFRTHHLHLIPFESPLWQERIRFRELLRSNEGVAAQYANLKRELAATHKEDREAYTDKKWPFIQQALQHA
ncbi:MAG: GrpB family protein [Oleiphilaceae bacterium]|nr:GrpB family protein [Oleiphilaceae bacterium]